MAVPIALALLSACSGAATPSGSPAAAGAAGATTVPIDVSTTGTITVPPVGDVERCDPIDPRHCLLPYPNDYYSTPDAATATGRRVRFDPSAMPANKGGVRVDPTDWNRADGFSPGSPIMTYLGPVDLGASRAAPVTDISASLAADSAVVLLDAATNTRVPHWVELDAHAPTAADQLVIVHPAVTLTEGHRYIVALRGLTSAGSPGTPGTPVAPTEVFRAYRDRLDTGQPALEQRRRYYEELFASLSANGVERGALQRAWAFTVASTRDRSERVLKVRDDALAQLGDRAPAFTITKVTDDVDDRIARRVDGTFQVPNYLTGDGSAGHGFAYGPDGLPARTGTEITMPFTCVIPRAALDPAGPHRARASLYGHGLLGTEGEVGAGNVRDMAVEHDIVFCATRWIGMAQDDIGNVVAVLTDFSKFPTIPDRLQQGLVGSVFLGRLMTRPDGLTARPEFQVGGQPVFDTGALFYDGNSQGAVVGGAAVAISPDVRRAVLGVPGMNFSLLLPRSSDFTKFSAVLDVSYPDALERALLIGIAQTLWDRGETNGYAQHLTDAPLPGTPTHAVLLQVAYGDFQVANVSAEVEARTIGARIHRPAVAASRSSDREPYWNIPSIPDGRDDGSALVIWDSGTPIPPTQNLAPTAGRDPHEDPRNSASARRQKSEFLRVDGSFTDVCDAQPCTAAPHG